MAASLLTQYETMLAASIYKVMVPCHLYRVGNATSPTLTKLRPIEKIPITAEGTLLTPPYQDSYLQGAFPGVSMFDAPVFTTGRLWRYHIYNHLPTGLCVHHDLIVRHELAKTIRHFAWLPSKEMKEDEYMKLLKQAEAICSPPAESANRCAWVLLPKSDIPPNGGNLSIVPEGLPHITAYILQTIRDHIVQLEEDAVKLGETDESMEMCEKALMYRNWYHSYLLNYSPSPVVPSLTFCGGGLQAYHTVVPRAKALPKNFIPVLHTHVFKMQQRAEDLMQRGKEDESLHLCDMLLFVKSIANSGVLQ